MEHTYYPTPELMQKAADVLFNPEQHTDTDRTWIAGQLQQRAANWIENGEDGHPATTPTASTIQGTHMPWPLWILMARFMFHVLRHHLDQLNQYTTRDGIILAARECEGCHKRLPRGYEKLV